jgi:hypothetical protein
MQKGVILGCGNRSNAGMDTVTLLIIGINRKWHYQSRTLLVSHPQASVQDSTRDHSTLFLSIFLDITKCHITKCHFMGKRH